MRDQFKRIPLITISVLILLVGAVSAQELDVSVTTDAVTYEVGANVTINLHNDSDFEVWSASLPPFNIYHVESAMYVYPGTGLPVLAVVWPHTTDVHGWDQLSGIDGTQVPPGHFEVRWPWFTQPPEPDHSGTASASFEILSPIGTEATSWTGVKSLFE